MVSGRSRTTSPGDRESDWTRRREDLERHLRQHDTLVEREISGASEAIEEYQAELDRFVGRLAGEREPTEIARLASLLPEPPRVEEIASAARAEAIAQLSRSEAGRRCGPGGPRSGRRHGPERDQPGIRAEGAGGRAGRGGCAR